MMRTTVSDTRVSIDGVNMGTTAAFHPPGSDCVVTLRAEKVRRIKPTAREGLRQQGLEYAPIVFSCFWGLASGRLLEHQLRQRIGVQLWLRSLAVCRRCLGGGVQACYRGPRLYDTDETKAMVKGGLFGAGALGLLLLLL